MACVATWQLGHKAPKITSGAHTPGVPQRWLVIIQAESSKGERGRWTLRPRQKLTLESLSEYVSDEIAQFAKEAGDLTHLGWTAISR